MLSSKASAEPGRWRTSRTPYLREIMDALSPSCPLERVVFMKGAQVGAPLALDVPIPTPTGWTTMGELVPGDYVLGRDGWPARVNATSPILYNRNCFEITFEDGHTVVCDADHLWSVTEFRKSGPRPRTVRTSEMASRVTWRDGTRYGYAVQTCAPVELPERDLPIHPYVLGIWLGDGNSWMNHVSVHEDDGEIAEHLNTCGVHAHFRLPVWRKGKCANIVIDPTFRILNDQNVSVASCGSSRFSSRLRLLNLVDNKHIPSAYLRASREQRLSLIQGLMDSDGCIDVDGGRCEFSNADPQLIAQMKEVLLSLGYKPSVYTSPAKRCEIAGFTRDTKAY